MQQLCLFEGNLNLEESKKIEIRMTINGKLTERLGEIRQYYQVENYEDPIRFMITQTYERIKTEPNREKPQTKTSLRGSLLDLIISGFVKEGLHQEIDDGVERRYRVEGGQTSVSHEEIGHVITNTLKQIVRDITEHPAPTDTSRS
jgi:hypothetical protein